MYNQLFWSSVTSSHSWLPWFLNKGSWKSGSVTPYFDRGIHRQIIQRLKALQEAVKSEIDRKLASAALWRPELRGKISMVVSPREVVGAVLKYTGASYNAKNFEYDVLDGRNTVKEHSLMLQRQV